MKKIINAGQRVSVEFSWELNENEKWVLGNAWGRIRQSSEVRSIALPKLIDGEFNTKAECVEVIERAAHNWIQKNT